MMIMNNLIRVSYVSFVSLKEHKSLLSQQQQQANNSKGFKCLCCWTPLTLDVFFLLGVWNLFLASLES